MALKATIHKALLQIADMDRGVYGDRSLTVARHPSENEERMMVRILAYALNVPASDDDGALEFSKGLSDPDEPDIWRKNLGGEIEQWIDLGQPDERRLARACGRARNVVVYSYAASTPIWWKGVVGKLHRLNNLQVWQLPAEQAQALAGLAERGMQLQITVQDGTAWVSDGRQSLEVTPQRLFPAA